MALKVPTRPASALLLTLALLCAPSRTPRASSSKAGDAPGPPVVAAAGDIACDPADPNWNGGSGTNGHCQEAATAQLLSSGLAAVLPLGDDQYACGGYQAFLRSYDPAWGRFRAISFPVPGNVEYYTSGGSDCAKNAQGYFRYFGTSLPGTTGHPELGFYAYDLGAWHVIALNSECSEVACDLGSQQERWLKADLAADGSTCTLAYWHRPRWEGHKSERDVQALWADLVRSHADVVLNGHVHVYLRFGHLDEFGRPTGSGGVRQFVVGTGGDDLGRPDLSAPGLERDDVTHFGVIQLTLGSGTYSWKFVSAGGAVLDQGSDGCVA